VRARFRFFGSFGLGHRSPERVQALAPWRSYAKKEEPKKEHDAGRKMHVPRKYVGPFKPVKRVDKRMLRRGQEPCEKLLKPGGPLASATGSPPEGSKRAPSLGSFTREH